MRADESSTFQQLLQSLLGLVVTAPFWVGGVVQFLELHSSVAILAYKGFENLVSQTSFAILVQLIGSILIIARAGSWFGAGMLAAYTIGAAYNNLQHSAEIYYAGALIKLSIQSFSLSLIFAVLFLQNFTSAFAGPRFNRNPGERSKNQNWRDVKTSRVHKIS